MNENGPERVIKLYRAYQSSRLDSDDYDTCNTLPTSTQQEQSETANSNAGDDENQERVIELYRCYRSDTDFLREQNIQHILTAAAAHNIANTTTAPAQSKHSHFLIEYIFSLFDFLKINQWQTAAAFSIAIILSTVLVMFYSQNIPKDDLSGSGLNLAGTTIELPAHFLTNSDTLAAGIEWSLPSSFGFSATRHEYQNIFRLGVVSADFPVLAKAGEHEKMQLFIREIRDSVVITANKPLVNSLTQIENALSVGTPTDNLVPLMNNFTNTLNDYFISHPMHAVYSLGRWTEVLLLAMALPDKDLQSVIAPLITRGKPIGARAERQLNAQTQVLDLVRGIQHLDPHNYTSAAQLRLLKNQLQQLKSALI